MVQSKDPAMYGAARQNHQALVDPLIAQGASKDEAVRGAAYGNHEELVNKLIEQGAFKYYAVIWGRHIAAKANNPALVDSLIR